MAGSRGTGRGFGAVAGVFIIPAAVLLLGWNEVRTVGTERALAEGAGAVREAPADRVDPALEGRLVHLSGPLTVPGRLADPDFPGVQAPAGAVQLRRAVQTYQLQERSSRGGSYSYDQTWSDQVIDSTGFRGRGAPQNPVPRHLAWRVVAPEARLGPYRLGETLLGALNGTEPLAVTEEAIRGAAGVRLFGNGAYVGPNPDVPTLGDQRIAWTAVRPETVSLIARQRGAGFVPYEAASGSSLSLISPGLLSAEEMLAQAGEANTALAWATRFMGTGLLFLAFFLILRGMDPARGWPARLAAVAGPGPARGAAVLAVMVPPAVILAAWLAMRPLVGAGVVVVAVLAGWWARRKAGAKDPPGPPSPSSRLPRN
ncbi:TMEM43 family protein [Muricoccus radiodurans]|uniref:TMEM43 family protein n=1 Tax=Muricoccus radiodurans TaxID=2231721 RepID=UPI003CEE3919